MNYEKLKELSAELESVAGEVDQFAESQVTLAETILDFERGSLTMPELVAKAKEVLK